jgi:hypothetical protein
MEYTTLPLAQVQHGLDVVPADIQATFGELDDRQLNWRPDATKWSVAQCFEHLLAANRLMVQAAQRALDETQAPTLWQRLPGLPGLWGRMLIRSQAPQASRKYKASPLAQPAASDIASDVVDRFLVQNHEILSSLRDLDDSRAARVIMTSPFVRFITYSVLDGARLILAHDHRHIEQARRVTQAPGFPRCRL